MPQRRWTLQAKTASRSSRYPRTCGGYAWSQYNSKFAGLRQRRRPQKMPNTFWFKLCICVLYTMFIEYDLTFHVPWTRTHSFCKLAVSDSGLWSLEFTICDVVNIWKVNVSMICWHLVRHPGLPSTPTYVHQNGNISQSIVIQIYGTRAKLPEDKRFQPNLCKVCMRVLLDMWHSEFARSRTSVSVRVTHLYCYVYIYI